MSCYSIMVDKRLQRRNLKGLDLLRKYSILKQLGIRFQGRAPGIIAMYIMYIMKTPNLVRVFIS